MRLLQGVRVVELSSFITGPLASMILAEYGADVIKVERPDGGDPFRSFRSGSYSPHFQAHNRNKRSIALNYLNPAGMAVLRGLVAKADIFIVNTRPAAAEAIGVSYQDFRVLNPRLIYCSITGFGPDGPYAERAAYDNVGQALSGWMSRNRRDDDPRVAGPAISDPATSYYAASGVLAALFQRTRSGKGSLVEVNMLEATIALNLEPLAYFFDEGETAPFYLRGANSQAYNLVCKDGLCIGLHLSSPDKFWKAFCKAIGQEDLMARYPTRMSRVDHYESIAATLKEIFVRKNRDEWMELLARSDIPFAPELSMAELEHDPQIKHLGTFYETNHPLHGRVRAQHRPVKIDGSRDIDFRPPPELGEHTDEVLSEAGFTSDQLRELYREGVLVTPK